MKAIKFSVMGCTEKIQQSVLKMFFFVFLLLNNISKISTPLIHSFIIANPNTSNHTCFIQQQNRFF